MKVYAHRGFSSDYPENTIIAYDKALENMADGIEIDVRRSLDGECVIMHDSTVDRTTNGTGAVSSLSSSYILNLDAGSWFDSQYSNEKVPSLDDVLSRFQNTDNFEIILHCNIDAQYVTDVIDIVVSHNMIGKCVIFSGDNTLLTNAKSYNPIIRCMTGGMPNINNYQSYLDYAIANNLEWVSILATESPTNIQTMNDNIHLANKISFASYIYSDYNTYIPYHLNNDTDCVLVNDVLTTINIINGNNPIEMYRQSSLWIKNDNRVYKLSKYIHDGNKYVKIK